MTADISELQRNVAELGLSIRRVIDGNGVLQRDIASVAETTRVHLAQANKNMEGLNGSVESLLEQIQATAADHTDDVGWRMFAFGLLVGLCALTWTEAQLYVLLAPLFGAMVPVCFPGVRRNLGLMYRRMMAKLELIMAPTQQQVAVVAAAGAALAQTAEHMPDPAGVNGTNSHH